MNPPSPIPPEDKHSSYADQLSCENCTPADKQDDIPTIPEDSIHEPTSVNPSPSKGLKQITPPKQHSTVEEEIEALLDKLDIKDWSMDWDEKAGKPVEINPRQYATHQLEQLITKAQVTELETMLKYPHWDEDDFGNYIRQRLFELGSPTTLNTTKTKGKKS